MEGDAACPHPFKAGVRAQSAPGGADAPPGCPGANSFGPTLRPPAVVAGTRLAPPSVMGHRSVEILIGCLVTDEDLRRSFIQEPRETLGILEQRGLVLTEAEVDALLASPVRLWERLAVLLDPRLQKASLKGG
jgi:hypothetical protein